MGNLRNYRWIDWNDLKGLFDSQIATLRDRGVPEQIVEIFLSQESAVLNKASGMDTWDVRIPFLPVIPLSFRGPYDLMAMVRSGGKSGYTSLGPTFDVVETPQEPYYIYNVEDGSITRGKSPMNAEETFDEQKRSPLTAAEVMALTTHTDVLSKHGVYAVGSRWGSDDELPLVYLDIDDRPELTWASIVDETGHWGSPSCGSR